jgi:hypothetical protein
MRGHFFKTDVQLAYFDLFVALRPNLHAPVAGASVSLFRID